MSDLPIPTEVLDPDQRGDPDWLRGASWNLPTRTDEFLAALGIKPEWAITTQRRIVARFMRRTAAQAMPKRLRNSLADRGLI